VAGGLGVRHLVVDADDFNLTAAVSLGIGQAHGAAIVTGTRPMEDLPQL